MVFSRDMNECPVFFRGFNLNSEVDLGTWGRYLGTPISRLAVGSTPFKRMAFPGPLPSGGLITEGLKTFLSTLLGIYRERLVPIQQYPNICESKRPFGRKEEESPHSSQKNEGLRHPKIQPTPKSGPPASTLAILLRHSARLFTQIKSLDADLELQASGDVSQNR